MAGKLKIEIVDISIKTPLAKRGKASFECIYHVN